MRILLVEDDKGSGFYLKKGLTEAGYLVDWAQSGVDGLHLGITESYDVVLLDVMLPGIDGWQLLKAWRAADIQTPVLMLTARDSVEDKVKGLELGADDYLVKPFAFVELLARVRALSRRRLAVASSMSSSLVLAGLEVDLLRRRVYRDGQLTSLTSQEFSLLELFMRRQGEVLSRALIASEVWDMNFDSDTNVVDVAIRRLRLKLEDGGALRLIHTVRGMGYVCEERE
ncbi:MAG: DNA-binding response regulator [Thiotrichales bacterium 16-46-22]|nr:MAG: DNA-binding response regulator [Thiotrichales bacterium 16-46-22]UCG18018.1 MAG: heavy metal response regulator transcription factor [Thiotrichales bacterium]HQR95817.1 heavy metal response regulator transcription factor [Thiotrichales bacterium]HQT02960.1 heavy metal response regulator transcription factor [Thiotrichales bacterium]